MLSAARLMTIAVLALSVTAALICFDTVEHAILHPIDFPASERLISLVASGDDGSGLSQAQVDQLRERASSIATIEAYRFEEASLYGPQGLDQVRFAQGTPGLFRLLGGVHPVRGRLFADEDFLAGAAPVGLLGDRYWRQRFNSDPREIGSVMLLDGKPVRIEGIVDSGRIFSDIDIWLPAGSASQGGTPANDFWAIGRLNLGVALGPARSQLRDLWAQMSAETEKASSRRGLRVLSLASEALAPVKGVVQILVLVSLLLYVLSLSNAAILVLSGANSEERMTAIRISLGSGRSREALRRLRACGIESLLASAAGIALFSAIRQLVLHSLPPGYSFLTREIEWLPSASAALVLAAFATIAVSAAPGMRILKLNASSVLQKRATQHSGNGQTVIYAMLLGVQCASMSALVAVACYLCASAWKIIHHPLGIGNPNASLLQLVAIKGAEDGSRQLAQSFQDAITRLRQDPRFQSVGASSDFPLGGTDRHVITCTVGDRRHCEDAVAAWVTDGYLEALGEFPTEGRLFGSSDALRTSQMIILSEKARRIFFGNARATGESLTVAGVPAVVVGVVPDAARRGPVAYKTPSPPQVYQLYEGSLSEVSAPRLAAIAIKSQMRGAQVAEAANEDLRGALLGARLDRIRTVGDIIASINGQSEGYAFLLLTCAWAAVIVTLLGIRGVSAVYMQGAARSSAIRLALGAPAAQVGFRVYGRAAVAISAGTIIGDALGWALCRVARSFLYGITPVDGTLVASAPILVAACALALLWRPFRALVNGSLTDILKAE